MEYGKNNNQIPAKITFQLLGLYVCYLQIYKDSENISYKHSILKKWGLTKEKLSSNTGLNIGINKWRKKS